MGIPSGSEALALRLFPIRHRQLCARRLIVPLPMTAVIGIVYPSYLLQ
jgi:hypothetical protein